MLGRAGKLTSVREDLYSEKEKENNRVSKRREESSLPNHRQVRKEEMKGRREDQPHWQSPGGTKPRRRRGE